MVGAEARRLRWAMLLVDFDPVEGHEQGGQRRALVVSYEPLHAAGMVAVCPVTAARAEPHRPGEVPIPAGEAGQTKPGLILCHQVRTISILRVRAMLTRGGSIPYLINPALRAQVRESLAVHLGLDIPGWDDGASADDHFASDEE
jgi:mRNA-degrading endonuclease toxin of MazEF toxin-antitoxin module